MAPLANLENELEAKLNAPSLEEQQAKYKKDIEKAINDRMIIMREIVVRTCTFLVFPDSRTYFTENRATT